MVRALVVGVVLGLSVPGHALQPQPPAAALQTCLADNTSGKDRKDLAKWIFLAMAAHPEMKEHAAGATYAAAADESSRRIAGMVVRLLAESCLKETRTVVQTGQITQSFEVAFSRLGELAMQELMSDKSVLAAMSQFEKYMDQKRFNEALIGK
jgi:hypothetical protein